MYYNLEDKFKITRNPAKFMTDKPIRANSSKQLFLKSREILVVDTKKNFECFSLKSEDLNDIESPAIESPSPSKFSAISPTKLKPIHEETKQQADEESSDGLSDDSASLSSIDDEAEPKVDGK